MTDYDVLRVFCAANGGYGNELGVVRNGSLVPAQDDRQELAAKLGFSETVFVDDPERGAIDTYTPHHAPVRHRSRAAGWRPEVELSWNLEARGPRPSVQVCDG